MTEEDCHFRRLDAAMVLLLSAFDDSKKPLGLSEAIDRIAYGPDTDDLNAWKQTRKYLAKAAQCAIEIDHYLRIDSLKYTQNDGEIFHWTITDRGRAWLHRRGIPDILAATTS